MHGAENTVTGCRDAAEEQQKWALEKWRRKITTWGGQIRLTFEKI